MPHYFIDTYDTGRELADKEGYDVADAEAARRLALASLPDLARDEIPDGDRRTFGVRVRDEQGTVLYSAELALHGDWHVPQGSMLP